MPDSGSSDDDERRDSAAGPDEPADGSDPNGDTESPDTEPEPEESEGTTEPTADANSEAGADTDVASDDESETTGEGDVDSTTGESETTGEADANSTTGDTDVAGRGVDAGTDGTDEERLESAVERKTEAIDDPDTDAAEPPLATPESDTDELASETGSEEAAGGLFGSGDGPAADEEMPLTAHIEEMVKRLAVVIAVAGVVSLVVFPFAEQVINFLWDSILPADATGELSRPRLYGVLELWFTKVKVASLGGLIVALPVLVYQTYRFMRPGLFPHERRYYLAAVPTSLVLALVGVAFAYFIVLPGVFTYFLYYSRDIAEIGFALGRTFNLILLMMAYLAIVFQIPLFLMLAMMMGLVTRQWLADRRLLFWGGFLGISFVFSPDPTGMVPILVAVTMVVLFEATLFLTKWTQNRRGGGGESAPA